MNDLLQLMHDTMGKTARIKGSVNLLKKDGINQVDAEKLLDIIGKQADALNEVIDAYYNKMNNSTPTPISTSEAVEKELKDITDEDIREIARLLNCNGPKDWSEPQKNDLVKEVWSVFLKDTIYSPKSFSARAISVYQYLQSKGYKLPKYH